MTVEYVFDDDVIYCGVFNSKAIRDMQSKLTPLTGKEVRIIIQNKPKLKPMMERVEEIVDLTKDLNCEIASYLELPDAPEGLKDAIENGTSTKGSFLSICCDCDEVSSAIEDYKKAKGLP
jgi:hypothetical protein